MAPAADRQQLPRPSAPTGRGDDAGPDGIEAPAGRARDRPGIGLLKTAVPRDSGSFAFLCKSTVVRGIHPWLRAN